MLIKLRNKTLFSLQTANVCRLTIIAAWIAVTPVVSDAQPVVPDEASKTAPRCNAAIIADLLSPDDSSPFTLTCSVQLPKASFITRPVMIEGAAGSGVSLDCNGGTIDISAQEKVPRQRSLTVRSSKVNGVWERPANVTVKNCTVRGAIRIYGLGVNGNDKVVRQSSLTENHTRNAQASAPTNISFSNMKIIGLGGIPFYIGPGVTKVSLAQSRIEGKSKSTAIYLDAESAENMITDNSFTLRTKKREMIAVDGSANNLISKNRFEDTRNGGIFLYRNCGEAGTIRHQKPQHNIITGNTFVYPTGKGRPAVWLNSRDGDRPFCALNPAYPFGSSVSSLDFAYFNTVTGNTIIGRDLSSIDDDSAKNFVENNAAK